MPKGEFSQKDLNREELKAIEFCNFARNREMRKMCGHIRIIELHQPDQWFEKENMGCG